MFRTLVAAAGLLAVLAVGVGAADLEGKVLKVGTDATYPPMETVDEATGEIVGFDVDMLTAVCERINCVLQFVNTAWDGIFAALQQGEFDLVVSGVSITAERDESMDFSDPYLVVSQAILVRVEDAELTAEDFTGAGRKLAAQTATTNAQLAEELVGRENVSLYDAFAGAILALQNGDVDGVVIDGTSGAAYEQEFAGELTMGVTGLQADPLGIVFQEGDPMVDAFNEGLAAIKADGTLDELIAKYWSD
ncbi:MAG: basic amino acid ABC transporter substrate-binding protein [Spirochaetaceae bacterium]|nr:basic amino acid ABC transporter substrate-binding protein [Spirochaetaceae bacterium]